VKKRDKGFSLIEVVLALGVISFAIVAIFGLLPTGLQTSHSSQDETRAAHLAEAILSSMASQAQTQFNSVKLQTNDASTIPVFNLSSTGTASTSVYADNDGKLSANSAGAIYAITVATNGSPTNFDAGYANQVTLTVGWPANAAAANQTKRDFVRIISKY
jgi:uncharacterized protein (TIGR02598 family)